MIQTVVIVTILIVAIYFFVPQLVGLGNALDKLGEADPVWLAVAVAFELVAFGTYVALFRGVVGGDVLPLTWREAYEINMAGLAATRLFSAGGAGGIALTYWALRKAGMERRQSASRMVAFLALQYIWYPLALIVFGILLRTGVLSGNSDVGVTIVPAAIAGIILVLGILIALIPQDFERRIAKFAQGHRKAGAGPPPRLGPGDAGDRDADGVRPGQPSLAGRARGRRRDRLLGGEHRHPLGVLQGLRRPRPARRRRAGLLHRHARQPLPLRARRSRRRRRRA